MYCKSAFVIYYRRRPAVASGLSAKLGVVKEGSAVAGAAPNPMDRFVSRAVFWAIPARVTPNHLTIARLVLCPLAAALYLWGLVWPAIVVFFLAALLDLVDGALARIRGPVTSLGLFLDPLADKVLIGVMLFCVGRHYLVVRIMLVLIAVELVALVVAQVTQRRVGLMARSNLFGKAKMWLQSLGVVLLLIAALMGRSGEAAVVGEAGNYVLWAGLALGIASAVMQAVQSPAVRRGLKRADTRSRQPD